MKKLLLVTLSILLFVGISSCETEEDKNNICDCNKIVNYYKEPLLLWGESKNTIKQKEDRTLLEEYSSTNSYGENIYILDYYISNAAQNNYCKEIMYIFNSFDKLIESYSIHDGSYQNLILAQLRSKYIEKSIDQSTGTIHFKSSDNKTAIEMQLYKWDNVIYEIIVKYIWLPKEM